MSMSRPPLTEASTIAIGTNSHRHHHCVTILCWCARILLILFFCKSNNDVIKSEKKLERDSRSRQRSPSFRLPIKVQNKMIP